MCEQKKRRKKSRREETRSLANISIESDDGANDSGASVGVGSVGSYSSSGYGETSKKNKAANDIDAVKSMLDIKLDSKDSHTFSMLVNRVAVVFHAALAVYNADVEKHLPELEKNGAVRLVFKLLTLTFKLNYSTSLPFHPLTKRQHHTSSAASTASSAALDEVESAMGDRPLSSPPAQNKTQWGVSMRPQEVLRSENDFAQSIKSQHTDGKSGPPSSVHPPRKEQDEKYEESEEEEDEEEEAGSLNGKGISYSQIAAETTSVQHDAFAASVNTDRNFDQIKLPHLGLDTFKAFSKQDFHMYSVNHHVIYKFGISSMMELLLEILQFHLRDHSILLQCLDCMLLLLDSEPNEDAHIQMIAGESNDYNLTVMTMIIERYPERLDIRGRVNALFSILYRNPKYKSWVLSKAGYVTNPKFADYLKLTSKIPATLKDEEGTVIFFKVFGENNKPVPAIFHDLRNLVSHCDMIRNVYCDRKTQRWCRMPCADGSSTRNPAHGGDDIAVAKFLRRAILYHSRVIVGSNPSTNYTATTVSVTYGWDSRILGPLLSAMINVVYLNQGCKAFLLRRNMHMTLAAMLKMKVEGLRGDDMVLTHLTEMDISGKNTKTSDSKICSDKDRETAEYSSRIVMDGLIGATLLLSNLIPIDPDDHDYLVRDPPLSKDTNKIDAQLSYISHIGTPEGSVNNDSTGGVNDSTVEQSLHTESTQGTSVTPVTREFLIDSAFVTWGTVTQDLLCDGGLGEVILEMLTNCMRHRDVVWSLLLLLSRIVFKGDVHTTGRLKPLGICEKLMAISNMYMNDRELYVVATDVMVGFARSPDKIGGGKKLLEFGVCEVITEGLSCNCKTSAASRWSHLACPYVCRLCLRSVLVAYAILHLEVEHKQALQKFKAAGFQGLLARPPAIFSEERAITNLSNPDRDLFALDDDELNFVTPPSAIIVESESKWANEEDDDVGRWHQAVHEYSFLPSVHAGFLHDKPVDKVVRDERGHVVMADSAPPSRILQPKMKDTRRGKKVSAFTSSFSSPSAKALPSSVVNNQPSADFTRYLNVEYLPPICKRDNDYITEYIMDVFHVQSGNTSLGGKQYNYVYH